MRRFVLMTGSELVLPGIKLLYARYSRQQKRREVRQGSGLDKVPIGILEQRRLLLKVQAEVKPWTHQAVQSHLRQKHLQKSTQRTLLEKASGDQRRL
jgi:hypothetical protein